MSFLTSNNSTVTVGPNIPLQGLTVCYDFSNPKCYGGSGDTVIDLSGNGINAELSGSGASRPTLVTSAGASYLSFTSANQHYMYCTLPTFGPSFTQICIYASPTATWDGIGGVGGSVRNSFGSVDCNGWTMDADNFSFPSFPYATLYSLESPSGGNNTAFTAVLPSSILDPHFYFLGWDNSAKDYVCGWDEVVTTSNLPGVTGRNSVTNSQIYFNRISPLYFISVGGRFTSSKLYLYLLYNRKLSLNEIKAIYNSIKTRFNFT